MLRAYKRHNRTAMEMVLDSHLAKFASLFCRCRRLVLAASAAMLLVPQGSAWAGQFDALLRPSPALPPGTAAPLAPLAEHRSVDGRLDVTLEARPTQTRLGSQIVNGATYNGVYGGPILRVRPGDILHVHLVNHLQQATNLHFHGLEVSPQGHGDNSMHMVQPGEDWDYVIKIPEQHPPGLYWYHTHGHKFAERQLMGGLSGSLVVEGFQDLVPATRPLVERVFALKEFSPDRTGDINTVPKPYNFTIKSINGQLSPRLDIRPGESQLWRFADQTANTYFRLSLQGHSFTVVGRDAHPVLHPETVREVMIGPSERVDVVVTAGAAGDYKLVAEKTSSGPAGDMFAAQDLALMASRPDAGQPPPAPLGPLTAQSGGQKPIAAGHIDEQRLISFSEDAVTGLFFINHVTFDHERVDVKVPLGNVEEWTIRNASDELHIFHIHQVAFQVISRNGRDIPFDGLVDTVNVPIHGEVKIRIAFTDPVIIGRFMFHCHILEHEDKGMMAQIEVYDPKVGPMPDGMAMQMPAAMASMPGMAGMDHAHMPGPPPATDDANRNAPHAAHP